MGYRQKLCIWLFSFLVLLSGCKKEPYDKEAPLLSIDSPTQGTFLNFGDTLLISGSVSDDRMVHAVTTWLQDEDGKKMLSGSGTLIQKSSSGFDLFLIAGDERLLTGNYTLVVQASDGINRKSAYINLNYLGAPLRLRKVYIATGTSSTTIHCIDSLLSAVSSCISLPGGTLELAVESYHGILFKAGENGASSEVVDLHTGSLLWQQPGSFGLPGITGTHVFDQSVFFTRYAGDVQQFGSSGFPVLKASAVQGYYPVDLAVTGEYLVTFQRPDATGNYIGATYWRDGGALAWQTPVSYIPVELVNHKVNEVFVLGNVGNQAVMEIYQADVDNLWTPHTLPAGKVLSAAPMDSERILIAHETGIYYYRYSNNSLIPLVPNVAATYISYDPVSNTVFAAEQNNLYLFNGTSGQPTGQFTFGGNIKGLGLLFNQ